MKRTTSSGGLRIVFDDTGSGSPAVVLIHADFANRSHFAPQIEHLAPRHRVLAPDLRGHGESESPQGTFGMSDLADDVIAVCDAAGVERAVLCGHACPTALVVAARRPDLVAGVALLDVAVLFPQALRTQVLSNLAPVCEGPGWSTAIQSFLGGLAFPYDTPELKARVMEEIAHGPAGLAAQIVRDVMSSDHADLLAAGDYPLLYVHGGAPIDLARLRQLRPDVVIGSVVGAGHYLTLEVPDQVNAMLDRFLQLVAEREHAAATDAAAVAAG